MKRGAWILDGTKFPEKVWLMASVLVETMVALASKGVCV
jgi:hypothetical protein